VFVPTKRAHQKAINSWVEQLASLRKQCSKLELLQVNVFDPSTPGLIISMLIEPAMRASFDDVHERLTIVVISSHEALERSLPGATGEEVVLLVVSKDGRVVARSTGAYTKANAARLSAALQGC
jgi:hypothetical protein